mmetsp:Transcript_29808/g.96164  ORF Transcript_29808/g.96164 Transcript_29808/m.96164 type:complete len:117 (+) Transcript_29808:321-671(+)
MAALSATFPDLEILLFPCNAFGGQEPLPAAEVAATMRKTYGVRATFMHKIPDVNGDDAPLVYKLLKAATNTDAIAWNFGAYFLVSKAGDISAHAGVNPSQLTDLIRHELDDDTTEL